MKIFLFSCIAVLLFTGCLHRYDITMTNGMRITRISRPKLDKDTGTYTFTDIRGNKKTVAAARVVEIAPHSNKPVNVSPP